MQNTSDEFVEYVLKDLERLRQTVDKLDLELDSFQFKIQGAAPSSWGRPDDASGAPFASPPGSKGRRRKVSAIKSALELAAESGIASFEYECLTSGKLAAKINGTPILLSGRLGMLLLLLADSAPTLTDPRPDSIVPWKDPEKLRIVLRKRDGAECSRHHFWVMLCRLRDTLSDAGINRYFVQTSENDLVRLAVRRQSFRPEIF